MPLPALTDTGLPGHYPTALIDLFSARDGTRLLLRPVLPQDAELLGALVQRLSRQSRARRFHAAVNGLSADLRRHMAHVDHRRHVAVVVTCGHGAHERIVADARYHVDAEDPAAAEFALVVDDGWQCQGLGRRAMQALAQAALAGGLRWLHGSVLADNAPMLALMQHCSFQPAAAGADDEAPAPTLRFEARVDRVLAATAADAQAALPGWARLPRWLTRWQRRAAPRPEGRGTQHAG